TNSCGIMMPDLLVSDLKAQNFQSDLGGLFSNLLLARQRTAGCALLEDGRIRIEMELDQDEYSRACESMNRLKSALQDTNGNKCCTCIPNGDRHNVSDDGLVAFFECLWLCGTSFQINDGACS